MINGSFQPFQRVRKEARASAQSARCGSALGAAVPNPVQVAAFRVDAPAAIPLRVEYVKAEVVAYPPAVLDRLRFYWNFIEV